VYSTITSKGQITLPSSLRRKLGLNAGLRVGMREVDGRIVIDPPQDLDAVRARAQAEMRAAGTWGAPVSPSDGWRAAAATTLAVHDG